VADEDKLKTQAKGLVGEYLSMEDFPETEKGMDTMGAGGCVFVCQRAVNRGFEGHRGDEAKMAVLLKRLAESERASAQDIRIAFMTDCIDFAHELVTDCPRFYELITTMLAPLLLLDSPPVSLEWLETAKDADEGELRSRGGLSSLLGMYISLSVVSFLSVCLFVCVSLT